MADAGKIIDAKGSTSNQVAAARQKLIDYKREEPVLRKALTDIVQGQQFDPARFAEEMRSSPAVSSPTSRLPKPPRRSTHTVRQCESCGLRTSQTMSRIASWATVVCTMLKVWNANTLEIRNRYDDGWGILKAGDIHYNGSLVNDSDKDLKKNITIFEKPIESDSALVAVRKIAPKFFEYKDEKEDNSYLGFVAQDLLAEIVRIGNKENNMLGYSLNEMVAFLWKAVQELIEDVEILEKKEGLI